MSRFPKLFVTDLDGTALGGGFRPYSRLPDRFAAFLDKLAEQGCAWATCTTWELPAQLNLLYASPIKSPPKYVIGGSGLYLTELADGVLEKLQPYTGGMEQALSEAVKADLHPLMRNVANRFDPVITSFNGYWYSMTVPQQDVEAMMDYMGSLEVRYPSLKIVRIAEENRFYAHPAFMSKGTPVRELSRLTGWTPEDIVVAGDEQMDLSMMLPDVAAYSICPDNAHSDVKARVLESGGFVGNAPCSDGVIDAFRQLARARGWVGFEAV